MDKRRLFAFLYRRGLKPVLFCFDPEDVHDHILKLGILLRNNVLTRSFTRFLFAYNHPMLRQTICNISFENPIGLSAGFDKNAQLLDILPCVGFGFIEVGSITGEACSGNPKPRLWRLKKSQSLLVYYGLKNDGCEAIANRLYNKKTVVPLGINIAKTNNKETTTTTEGILDYIKAYKAFETIGSYYTINISCPNTYGGEPFTNPDKLELLLSAIDQCPHTKPVFLKLSPDLSPAQLDTIITICNNHNINGFISSNLTKNRSNPHILDKNIPDTGGISGKAVESLANEQIRYLYSHTHGKYIIIGCGGVSSAKDAYIKIKSGASLIELITGMIYEGPQLIGQINEGLVELLKQDGFSNIQEAIGSDIAV